MTKEKLKVILKMMLPALPPALLYIIFLLVTGNDIATNVYIKKFSMPLRHVLGKISSLVPLSLMEVCYAVLIIWLLYFLGKTIYNVVKKDRSAYIFIKRIFTVFVVFFYIVSLYSLLFGVDYYGESFPEKADWQEVEAISKDDLIAVTEFFAQNAAYYSTIVPRDEDGSVIKDVDNILSYASLCYDGIYSQFPFLEGEIFTPKRVIFSVIMSYLGFTGVYFPFTGESNINIHSPAAFIPATVAHEIAHQKGITSEAECNFVAVLACITSEDVNYIYSGYLKGLVHLMNALYTADREAWSAIAATFTPELAHDWNENNEYWSEMEISITKISESVYDGYLKNYGEELGMESYGACVLLLVDYFSRLGLLGEAPSIW